MRRFEAKEASECYDNSWRRNAWCWTTATFDCIFNGLLCCCGFGNDIIDNRLVVSSQFKGGEPMTFPPPLELSLFGLYEPGVPGKERIVLRPTESVNLAQFGIMLGWKLANGNVVPINDNFFWFREMIAVTPSWIIIFTG